MSSEAQSKSKQYPTPQTSTVFRKVANEFNTSGMDSFQQIQNSSQGELSDTRISAEKLIGAPTLLKEKSPMKFQKPKDDTIIVAASESGSNEDRIEKINPPWVKTKTPIKYGKEVGGILLMMLIIEYRVTNTTPKKSPYFAKNQKQGDSIDSYLSKSLCTFIDIIFS